MGTGMHDGRIFACMGLPQHFRFIWQTCFLLQRKRIHIRPQHDCWSVAIFHHGHNAITANIFAKLADICYDFLFDPSITKAFGDLKTEIF